MIVSLSVCFAAKPTVEAQLQAKDSLKRIIETQRFGVNVMLRKHIGEGMGTIEANELLIFVGNQVRSTLPYVNGKGYSSYGDDANLNFDGALTSYTVTEGKKNTLLINCTVKEPTGRTYTIVLDLYPNGITLIRVAGDKLQAVSYRGAFFCIPEIAEE